MALQAVFCLFFIWLCVGEVGVYLWIYVHVFFFIDFFFLTLFFILTQSPVILNNAVSTGSDGSGSSIVTGSAPVQSHLTSLKCQAMDDVLEILIRNGG